MRRIQYSESNDSPFADALFKLHADLNYGRDSRQQFLPEISQFVFRGWWRCGKHLTRNHTLLL